MTLRSCRFLRLLALLSLPLVLSQCAGKQNPDKMRQELMKRQAAINAADRDWEKKRAKTANKSISPERLEALGDLSLQTRDYETSLINFLEVLSQDPSRYDIRYKVGVIFFLNGQYEAARQQFALVLVQRPEMLEAHEALGLVHLEEKNFTLAIGEFQLVLNKDPRRTKARHLLGIAYLEAGQNHRAIGEFERILVLDPGNVNTLTALGQAYLKQNDCSRALIYLKKAQSLAPQNPKVHRHLGMALAGLKRYGEALEAFTQAGDEAQAYNNIGVYLFKDGRYEDAAKCFQRALDLRATFYQEAKTNLQRALEKLQQSRQDS